MNPYFWSYTPLPRNTNARAEAVNAIFDGIVVGFDNVPTAAQIAAAATAQSGMLVVGAGPNTVIDGDFRINQRAYVSGAALTAGSYGHDRWKAGGSGGDYSFTQLSSQTQITIAASKSLIQVVAPENVSGTTYVLSWLGNAVARYAINGAVPAGTFAVSPIIITGQTPGATMSIEFTGANAVGTSAVASNTGTLGTVKLEVGSVPTAYVMDDYAASLAKCQRYYARLTAFGVNTAFGAGVCYTTNSCQFYVKYPVAMRGTPTFNGSGITANDGLALFPITALGTFWAGSDSGLIQCTCGGGGMTARSGVVLAANNSTTGYIELISEL